MEEILLCDKCKGVVLKQHMGKPCPYCENWLYFDICKETKKRYNTHDAKSENTVNNICKQALDRIESGDYVSEEEFFTKSENLEERDNV